MREPDPLGRPGGLGHQLDGLVVGGDEDVDRLGAERLGGRAAPLDPPHRHPEQVRVDQRVGLGDHQRHGDPPVRPVDGEQPPPADVEGAGQQGEDHEDPYPEELHGAPGALLWRVGAVRVWVARRFGHASVLSRGVSGHPAGPRCGTQDGRIQADSGSRWSRTAVMSSRMPCFPRRSQSFFTAVSG